MTKVLFVAMFVGAIALAGAPAEVAADACTEDASCDCAPGDTLDPAAIDCISAGDGASVCGKQDASGNGCVCLGEMCQGTICGNPCD